jgi:polysaccharide deacetylase 2 family uncharacterized protein YibQ
MARKDLNKPLYRETRERPPRRRPFVVPVLVSAASLVALTAALWVAVVDDPDGGRAVAVAMIREAAPAATGSIAEREAEESPPAVERGMEVAAFPGMLASPAGGVPGLTEHSAFGPLPRVSPEGRRPREVYARPATAPADSPRVAIVVGGLGLSQTGTQRAIEALPEDVTLAFAPYGASLQRWAAKARAEGHEIVLQIPLEPQGYPQENPGEHTLLVSAPGDLRNNLHWVLGRFSGYAGVMNYMGARFTADERALVPLVGEIGERGLYFLDDGSSPESRIAAVGEGLRVPVARADRILDQDRAHGGIERALSELEAIAATRGYAVGVATAFPNTIEAITRWAEGAEGRGIALVPASAILVN